MPSHSNYRLYLPSDKYGKIRDEEELSILINEITALKCNFEKLIKYIRENYLEINVDTLSEIAGEKYNDYIGEKK